MRVNDDYAEWNAASQVDDGASVWSFWKKALAMRKAHDVLVSARAICLTITGED